jgi:hypothetical protein
MRSSHSMRGVLLALVTATACSDTPVAPAPGGSSDPSQVTPVTPLQPAVLGTADAPLRLTGGGVLAEYTINTNHGTEHHWLTAFTAGSGPLVEENGLCCRILADTILQVNVQDILAVGTRIIEPPRLELGGADFRRYGGDDVVLMIRESSLRMRFVVPVKPVTLEVTGWIAPTAGKAGEIRGRMSFEGLALVQERASVLDPQFLRQEGITTVHAEFVTPLRYEARTLNIPPQ